MTNKEAITTIEVAKAEVEWEYPMDYQIAFDVAIEALEKQVPMKPIPFTCDSGDTPHQAYRCPVCGEEVLEGDGCSNNDCRQKIDWSDNND